MIKLANGYVVENNELVKKDIYIDNGKIVEASNTDTVYDCTDCVILPGACDIHVHLREPGLTHKETIKSGTLAAAKGGVTDIFAMPNIIPFPDSVTNIKVEEEIIKRDAVVNVYPYACLTKEEKSNELADIEELDSHVLAYTDDGVPVTNDYLLVEGMKRVKALDKVICSHAEDKILRYSPESEYITVNKEIAYAKLTGIKYHFCHLSTRESFEYIEKAQKEGYPITCEVTPHHLFLSEEDINGNTNFKMNPPLRSKDNQKATLEYLLKGVASIIASDHAPHQKFEKDVEYNKAPNGILGLETMLPLVYTNLVKTNKASWQMFIDWFVNNPRKLMNLPELKVAPGYEANIAVMDIKNERIYTEEEILSLSKNSPFIGKKLSGFMRYTFVKGNLVYRGDK